MPAFYPVLSKQNRRLIMDSSNPDLAKTLKQQRKIHKPGATGKFPEGKLVPNDEGEVRLIVGHFRDKVIVDFGTPVKWFAMEPEQAIELAKHIRKNAEKAQIVKKGN
jgi:hypothetical protein